MTTQPDPRLDRYYAQPQTLVRINSRRRLNLLITGDGAPTVILAPGGNSTMFGWSKVQLDGRLDVRMASYDNAGSGFSDPGPLPRTGLAILRDLRTALAIADISPPYVLVGWSFGGLVMRLFAFLHPEEVVGMVMVDSVIEHHPQRLFAATGDAAFALDSPRGRAFDRRLLNAERSARAGQLTPGTADYDDFVGTPNPELSLAMNAVRQSQLTAPARFRAFRSELANAMTTTSDEIAAVRRPLGDMPLIVLTAKRLPPAFQPHAEHAYALHDEIAALSTRGEHRTVDAGHAIQIERPEVVLGAIQEVLAAVRKHQQAAKS